MYQILASPNKYLLKDEEYLIVCERGIQSKKVSEILNNMGYHTYYSKAFINSKEN